MDLSIYIFTFYWIHDNWITYNYSHLEQYILLWNKLRFHSSYSRMMLLKDRWLSIHTRLTGRMDGRKWNTILGFQGKEKVSKQCSCSDEILTRASRLVHDQTIAFRTNADAKSDWSKYKLIGVYGLLNCLQKMFLSLLRNPCLYFMVLSSTFTVFHTVISCDCDI